MKVTLPTGFRQDAYRVVDGEIDNLVEELTDYCESPIEVAFAAAFVLLGRSNMAEVLINEPGWVEDAAPNRFDYLIFCQRQIDEYRVDFLVSCNPNTPGCRVIVECDGHDFHERTKEQAKRDRSRDRELQKSGYKVFRFTGSEIYRGAFNCANEVYDALFLMMDEEIRSKK